MNKKPTHASPRYARKRVRDGPPSWISTSIANDPKAAKIDVCGFPIALSASAKTAGITIAARAALFSAAISTAGDDTSAPARRAARSLTKGEPQSAPIGSAGRLTLASELMR
jgi:hypothetical protein